MSCAFCVVRFSRRLLILQRVQGNKPVNAATLWLGFINESFLEDAKDGNSRVFFAELSKVAAGNQKWVHKLFKN